MPVTNNILTNDYFQSAKVRFFALISSFITRLNYEKLFGGDKTIVKINNLIQKAAINGVGL